MLNGVKDILKATGLRIMVQKMLHSVQHDKDSKQACLQGLLKH
ncbi:MAG: hypothetical protein JWP94_3510 [Mucilaginibacter sp.]|nr:hypothetical protein [Mucilaginibacter sp.]